MIVFKDQDGYLFSHPMHNTRPVFLHHCKRRHSGPYTYSFIIDKNDVMCYFNPHKGMFWQFTPFLPELKRYFENAWPGLGQLFSDHVYFEVILL